MPSFFMKIQDSEEMPYEEETDYSTTNYRCIDPIENFRVKIVLQPVKNLYIPLPQFDVEQYLHGFSPSPEQNQLETEERTFKWQEKLFSRNEIKKFSNETDWSRKLCEKYHESIKDDLNNMKNSSNKIFSYVEADNYLFSENELETFTTKINYTTPLNKRINDLKITGPNLKNYKNVPKRKVINYYPTEEFKRQAHLINKNVQKMYIMVDLGSKVTETNKSEEEEHYQGLLCTISYDYSNCVLQVTPSFSKSESKPYSIGMQNENGRNFYYYWIFHASESIKGENLTKEIQLMSKMFDYQEEVKKLHIDTEFFIGKPDHIYVTLLGEIKSADNFEYDNLHIHYFIKLPQGWGYSDIDSLIGRTQTCNKNSQGICYFSHLFEMNFCLDLISFDDPSGAPLELFFEVLSLDKYKRYRNEGYTYITIPKSPGMYDFSLKCWRLSDKTIRSQLERFFIGGGPELEDISYVGISTNEKPEVMSRFGLQTVPSGTIDVKLNILHQSKNFADKKDEQSEFERESSSRLDAGSLLGSVNAVLEAFRRARERMLQAKKGLQTNINSTFPKIQDNNKKSV